jgi:hypothetical protein
MEISIKLIRIKSFNNHWFFLFWACPFSDKNFRYTTIFFENHQAFRTRFFENNKKELKQMRKSFM